MNISIEADLREVNMNMTIKDRNLINKYININKKTIGNLNITINTKLEKDKYIVYSRR